MACRANRMDWRDAAPPSWATGARWPCRGTRSLAVATDTIMIRLSVALAPPDPRAVSAGILDRLREHGYLPPEPPAALP